ncbi:MAG: GxxExxY protein [Bacteroidetes bacterium]|nr:MAG: GxxExxY protein [Bacteroidota bacterium]
MTKKQVTQLSYEITGCAITVHRALGPGLLESVYQKCLTYELIKKGYSIIQQLAVPVNYDGLVIDTELRLDLLVNDIVVVELKAIEFVLPVHEAQILTYMKLLRKPQGLLINFFTENITSTLKPFVNEYFKALPDC